VIAWIQSQSRVKSVAMALVFSGFFGFGDCAVTLLGKLDLHSILFGDILGYNS